MQQKLASRTNRKSRQATFLDTQKVDLRFFRENTHNGIDNRRSINDDISMNIRDIIENSKTIN